MRMPCRRLPHRFTIGTCGTLGWDYNVGLKRPQRGSPEGKRRTQKGLCKRLSSSILSFFLSASGGALMSLRVKRLDAAVIVLKTTLPKLRAAHVFCPGTKIQGQNNRSAPCKPRRVLKVCFATTIPECVVQPATAFGVRVAYCLRMYILQISQARLVNLAKRSQDWKEYNTNRMITPRFPWFGVPGPYFDCKGTIWTGPPSTLSSCYPPRHPVALCVLCIAVRRLCGLRRHYNPYLYSLRS